MDVMATEHADTAYARRLAALLDHLKWSAAEFSARTGLTQDYVSKVLSGDRGRGSKPLQRLHIATEKALGLGGHYWTAEADIPPEKAYVGKPQHGGDLMAVITGAQVFGGQRPHPDLANQTNNAIRTALVNYAAERDESGDMIKELARVKAPETADVIWWIRCWIELSEKYPRRTT